MFATESEALKVQRALSLQRDRGEESIIKHTREMWFSERLKGGFALRTIFGPMASQ